LAYLLIQNTDRFLRVLKQRIDEYQRKNLNGKLAFQKLIRTCANCSSSNKEVRLLVLRERHQLTAENKRHLFKREQAIFHLLKNELVGIPHVDKGITPT